MCRSSDTWRLCRLSEALTPLPFMVVEPPEIRPFQLKRKIRWGGISKNESKGGFLVGRARVCPRRRQGGASAILLEIGSNFSVQGSHKRFRRNLNTYSDYRNTYFCIKTTSLAKHNSTDRDLYPSMCHSIRNGKRVVSALSRLILCIVFVP